MKNVILLVLVVSLFVACKKKEEIYKVKFEVTGNSINDFKINYGSTISTINKEPFSGTRDTTIVLTADKAVSLNAKSTGGELKGKIYVNDVLAIEKTDTDLDGDGKTEVKIDFVVK